MKSLVDFIGRTEASRGVRSRSWTLVEVALYLLIIYRWTVRFGGLFYVCFISANGKIEKMNNRRVQFEKGIPRVIFFFACPGLAGGLYIK